MFHYSIKYLVLLFLFFSALIYIYTSRPIPEPESSIYPISVRVQSLTHKFPDMGLFSPDIVFDFLSDSIVKVTVGHSEELALDMKTTHFNTLLRVFADSNFANNGYWYNPYQQESGTIKISKRISDTIYTGTYSDYVRQDIPVRYEGMTIEMGPPVANLSDYAHRIAYGLLRDTINRNEMITATSIQEALKQPEKVHSLRLRNQEIKQLPPDIARLTNLRLLDVSGTLIEALPPEIGQCKELRSLIANASRLEEVPPEIGQLKKLRFLNLGACRLTKLPKEIGDLRSLWTVNIGGNRLKELPVQMAELDNVVFFGANNNQLTEFPGAALGLHSVSNLWLHGNDFTHVPKELAELEQLSHFLVDVPEVENINVLKQARPWVRVIDHNGR